MFADCVNNYMSAFNRIIKDYPASNKDCISNSANNLETDDKVVQIQQRTCCLVNVSFEGLSINGRKRKFNQISSAVPASASDVLMGSKRQCQDLNCPSSEIKALDSETGGEASKIEGESPAAFDFLQLDVNVVDQIFSHLSHKDLLQFERLAKGYKDITGPIWKSYAQREHLDSLWWRDSDLTPNREFGYKWNYCLSKVMIQYVKEGYPCRFSKSLELAKKINARYGRVIKRFPFFKAYVKQDIFRIGSSLRASRGDTNLFIEELKEDELKSGDYLLNALFEAKKLRGSISKVTDVKHYQDSFDLLEEYMVEAIKKGGAYANLFLFYALSIPSSYANSNIAPSGNQPIIKMEDMVFSFHKRLLKVCAAHDLEGLEYLLKNYPDFSTHFYPYGYYVPLLLADFIKEAIKEGKWAVADALCAKAFASYKEDVAENLWFKAIQIKLQLNQILEAETLYQDALLPFADKSDLTALAKIASIKIELGKWQEADTLLTFIIGHLDQSGQKSTDAALANLFTRKLELLRELTFIKIKLEKWQQADDLYTQMLAIMGKNLTAKTFVQVAFIKAKLGDLKAASQHYAKAIKAYGNDVPAGIFADVALIKLQMHRYKDSDVLYEKAIATSGNQLPLAVWNDALGVKIKLKKWQEAERHLECIQAIYGTGISPEITEKMHVVKDKLNH
ncbi:tetratricopeptide repeat protein [Candidatus Protochlamydia phocaeensis]|uniref:tetratricopeptide repeat protein n=1 Tax=Candidatus Protochlamydia phocaeensis TaxID=1414722 RepID=UPI000837C7D6|nr:hypothetical protein [Candidatus Protochlamydia phocaeensis]